MISVVIPAYNEEKTLPLLLESFIHQTSKKPYEIILVNNNSTDNTDKIANSFKDRLPIHVILEKQKGRGPARRTGFATAKGEIILSTDADAILPPTWIETMSNYFHDITVSAVTGTCVIKDLNFIDREIFNFIQPKLMFGYRLVWGHYWLTGSNFGIRKIDYEKAGGFDISLNAMEDIHLSPKVHQTGKIILNSSLPVTVSGRRFEDNLFKGLFEYGWSFTGYRLRGRQKAHLRDNR
ncbi:hypothetical protein BH09PAT1_BH09PAT1_5500 [soil metagenome]